MKWPPQVTTTRCTRPNKPRRPFRAPRAGNVGNGAAPNASVPHKIPQETCTSTRPHPALRCDACRRSDRGRHHHLGRELPASCRGRELAPSRGYCCLLQPCGGSSVPSSPPGGGGGCPPEPPTADRRGSGAQKPGPRPQVRGGAEPPQLTVRLPLQTSSHLQCWGVPVPSGVHSRPRKERDGDGPTPKTGPRPQTHTGAEPRRTVLLRPAVRSRHCCCSRRARVPCRRPSSSGGGRTNAAARRPSIAAEMGGGALFNEECRRRRRAAAGRLNQPLCVSLILRLWKGGSAKSGGIKDPPSTPTRAAAMPLCTSPSTQKGHAGNRRTAETQPPCRHSTRSTPPHAHNSPGSVRKQLCKTSKEDLPLTKE